MTEKAVNRQAGWRSSDGETWLLPKHYADTEQGIPNTQVTAEATQEGGEMNKHRGRVAKAMSRDSEWDQKSGSDQKFQATERDSEQ